MGSNNHPTVSPGNSRNDSPSSNWNIEIVSDRIRYNTGLTVRASSEIQAESKANKKIKNIIEIFTSDTVEEDIYTINVNRIIV